MLTFRVHCPATLSVSHEESPSLQSSLFVPVEEPAWDCAKQSVLAGPPPDRNAHAGVEPTTSEATIRYVRGTRLIGCPLYRSASSSRRLRASCCSGMRKSHPGFKIEHTHPAS